MLIKLVRNYAYKTLVLITVKQHNFAQAQVQTKDKANKCSEVCDVIVYGKQKHIQKKSLSAFIRKPPRKTYF